MTTARRDLFSLEELKVLVAGADYAHPEQLAKCLGLEATHSARVLVGQALAVLGWTKFSRRCWMHPRKAAGHGMMEAEKT